MITWFDEDICWCSDSCHCSNIKCYRNDKRRKKREGIFTYAAFKGTDNCPSYFKADFEED